MKLIKLALILPLLSFSSYANDELDRLLAMSLEELLEVKITGSTNLEEDTFSIPASVTVFTYEQIQQMSVNSLEELSNYVPGFQSSRDNQFSNGGTLISRGRIKDVAQADVLILLDGQRLNTDYSGGAVSANRLHSLDNIERVEFIKGAGSSLYGSNAFTGVINLISKKDLNNVATRFSQHQLRLYSNYSYDDLQGFRVSAYVNVLEDRGESYPSQLDIFDGTYRNPKDKNRGTEAYFNADYKNFNLILRHKNTQTKQWYHLRSNSDKSASEVLQDYIRLGYNFESIENLKSTLYTSYAYSTYEGDVALGLATLAKPNLEEKSFSVQWDNQYAMDEEHSLGFGLEYRKAKLSQADLSENGGPKVDIANRASRDIYGLYAQYQARFSELSLTAGARYDKYSDFGSSFNPRLALVYQANEDTSLKLLYSKAFRAPTQSELELKNNTITQGNPNLEAEDIDTYEAVLIQRLGNSLLNLSYFYNEIDNVIENRPDNNGIVTPENLGNEHFSGVEAELISNFLNNDLSTRFSLAHLTHLHTEASPAPKTTLSAILNYRLNQWNFDLNGYYHSSVEDNYTTGLKKLSGYTLVNTKLAYTFSSSLRSYLEVQNLFDEDYLTPSIVGNTSFDIQNRGRLFYLGLEYLF